MPPPSAADHFSAEHYLPTASPLPARWNSPSLIDVFFDDPTSGTQFAEKTIAPPCACNCKAQEKCPEDTVYMPEPSTSDRPNRQCSPFPSKGLSSVHSGSTRSLCEVDFFFHELDVQNPSTEFGFSSSSDHSTDEGGLIEHHPDWLALTPSSRAGAPINGPDWLIDVLAGSSSQSMGTKATIMNVSATFYGGDGQQIPINELLQTLQEPFKSIRGTERMTDPFQCVFLPNTESVFASHERFGDIVGFAARAAPHALIFVNSPLKWADAQHLRGENVYTNFVAPRTLVPEHCRIECSSPEVTQYAQRASKVGILHKRVKTFRAQVAVWVPHLSSHFMLQKEFSVLRDELGMPEYLMCATIVEPF